VNSKYRRHVAILQRLYINGKYLGLYSNVEANTDDFLINILGMTLVIYMKGSRATFVLFGLIPLKKKNNNPKNKEI
jgi:hypothetical protein